MRPKVIFLLRTALLVLPALAAWLPCAAAARPPGPCPAIRFTGRERITLSPMEIRLVCGDSRTEGWGRVPFNQAESFLRAFLQQRGYQEPEFGHGLEVLTVSPGRRTRVTRLTVAGLPLEIDPGKLRKITGEVLTPKILDSAKAALLTALRNRGYACPTVEIRGNGSTGELSAEVRPGAIGRFGHLSSKQTPGIAGQIFRRYEAFRPGQRFDARLLDLTAQRTMSDSLFLNAYFEVGCDTGTPGALTISERIVAGEPRLYKLGLGFDTEGLLLGRAQWKNSRIGRRGHSMQAALYGSAREQSAVADFRYFTGPASRFYLMPKLTFSRLNEEPYESVRWELALQPGGSWDSGHLRGEFSAGPALEDVRTLRGLGPDSGYAAFKTRLELRSHLFEYYAGDPRTGWRAAFSSQSRLAGAYSAITAHRLELRGEQLWNLGGFDPPLLVLANRCLAQTTLVRRSLVAAGDLPPDMRYFLGGDADLRGAARSGLPRDAAGLLTAVYDGVELRLGDALPHGLQPLVFLDAAMAGRGSLRLDPNVYFSPGCGIRWTSPIGTVRATLARGVVWRREPDAEVLMRTQWRLFLSLGREF